MIRGMRVAFIGIGIMGSRMAANLVRTGHELTVWNRTREKAEAWAEVHGGTVAATPADAAAEAEVAITMVVDGAQVEAVLLGPDGVAEGAGSDLLCVDMSTIAPADTRRIGAALAERAGVGVGTVYRHFPTKEALVLELVRESVGGCIDAAAAALERDDPWEAVESVVRDNAQNMARNRGLRDAMAGVDFPDDCPWEDSQLRGHAAALIERAQSAGAMRAGITVDDYQALMCGLAAAIASGGDPERQSEFALAGLRAP